MAGYVSDRNGAFTGGINGAGYGMLGAGMHMATAMQGVGPFNPAAAGIQGQRYGLANPNGKGAGTFAFTNYMAAALRAQEMNDPDAAGGAPGASFSNA